MLELRSRKQLPTDIRQWTILPKLRDATFSIPASLQEHKRSRLALAKYSEMVLRNNETEATNADEGLRLWPVTLRFSANELQNFNISVDVKEGDFYKFKFSVAIRAS